MDRTCNAQGSADYLKLNPKGRIPVSSDDGLVLFEAAAITMHLADRHPQATLAPPPGTPERGHFVQADGLFNQHALGGVHALVLPPGTMSPILPRPTA
jgi:glutathione S-transferase